MTEKQANDLFAAWPHLSSVQLNLLGEPVNYLPAGYESRLRSMMTKSIARAKERQATKEKPVPVTLTFQEGMAILKSQNYRCALTRMRFWADNSGGSFGPRIPSLDRIQFDGPYAADNVRVILLGINGLRGCGTDDEMYALAEALLKARKKPDRSACGAGHT